MQVINHIRTYPIAVHFDQYDPHEHDVTSVDMIMCLCSFSSPG